MKYNYKIVYVTGDLAKKILSEKYLSFRYPKKEIMDEVCDCSIGNLHDTKQIVPIGIKELYNTGLLRKHDFSVYIYNKNNDLVSTGTVISFPQLAIFWNDEPNIPEYVFKRFKDYINNSFYDIFKVTNFFICSKYDVIKLINTNTSMEYYLNFSDFFDLTESQLRKKLLSLI